MAVQVERPWEIMGKRLDFGLGLWTMFKIEVLNALQTHFGPSIYTSLKISLQNATPT
jgi:hypothetical protein